MPLSCKMEDRLYQMKRKQLIEIWDPWGFLMWSLLTRLHAVRLLFHMSTQPPCELLTVPHEQLTLGLHGPDGVEVDITAVLTGHQVLLGRGTCRVDETHPVAAMHIISINEVVKLPTGVNLKDKNERLVIESVNKYNLVNKTSFKKVFLMKQNPKNKNTAFCWINSFLLR